MNRICSKVSSAGLLGAMALMLAGCGTPAKNTTEFRAMAKSGQMFMSYETFPVKRPYQQVVNSFKQRAPACLNVTVSSVNKQNRVMQESTWKAKVSATDKHMELILQMRLAAGNVYEYPHKDGHYMLVVDAYPVDQNTTNIVLNKTAAISDRVIQASKNWANGSNMGCPDMTQ